MVTFLLRIMPFVGMNIKKAATDAADEFLAFLCSASGLVVSLFVLLCALLVTPWLLPLRALKRRREDHAGEVHIKKVLADGPLPRRSRLICERSAWLFPNDSLFREILELDDAKRRELENQSAPERSND